MNISKLSNLRRISKVSFKGTFTFTKISTQIIEEFNKYQTTEEQKKKTREAFKQFYKAFNLQQKLDQQTQNALNQQINSVFTKKTPISSILETYIKYKSGIQNEDLIANTLHQLGQVVASRGQIPNIYWDQDKYSLFNYSLFRILVNDTFELLKTSVKIDLMSIHKIALSLPQLQYFNQELITLVQERFLQEFKQINQVPPSILQIPEFRQTLSELLRPDEQEINLNIEDKELTKSLEKLIKIVRESQLNILKIFDTIQKIRNTYYKFVDIQQEKFIVDNIELNFDLLEIEEMLVELGLISIDEIKKNRSELTPEENQMRLAEIAYEFICKGSQQTEYFINYIVNYKFDKKTQPKQLPAQQNLNLQKIGDILISIAECSTFVAREPQNLPEAKLDSRENQSDRLKDQILLTNQHERVFNKFYLRGLQIFQEILPQLKQNLLTDFHIEGPSKSALAYAKIGLYEEAHSILKQVNPAKLKSTLPFFLEAALITDFPIHQIDLVQSTLLHQRLDNHQLLVSILAVLYQCLRDNSNVSVELIEQVVDRFEDIESFNEIPSLHIQYLNDILMFIKIKNVSEQQEKRLTIILSGQDFPTGDESVFLQQLVSHLQNKTENESIRIIKQNLQTLPLFHRPQIYYQSPTSLKTVALTILPTSLSSTNGLIDGRVQFRQQLLQKLFHNVTLKNLPLINLLDSSFKLKEKKEFNDVLKSIFDIQEKDITIYHSIRGTLLQIEKELGEIPIIEDGFTKKSKEELLKMNLNYQIQKGIQMLNDVSNTTTAKARYIQNLLFILVDIDKKLKLFGSSQNTNLATVIKDLSGIAPAIKQKKTSKEWFGKIQTESQVKSKSSLPGFYISLLDQDFILDASYCQFKDVQDRLERVGLLGKSMYQNRTIHSGEGAFMSRLDTVSIYPKFDGFRKQLKPNFNLEWRNYANHMKEEVKKELGEIQEILIQEQNTEQLQEEQDWLMINLLNLKQELKQNYKLTDISAKILNLQFWDLVLEEKLKPELKSNRSTKYIDRDGDEIIRHNLNKFEKSSLNSKTLQFMLDRKTRKESLEGIFKLRKEILNKLSEESQNQNITRRQIESAKKSLNDVVLKKIKAIKQELTQIHTSRHYPKR